MEEKSFEIHIVVDQGGVKLVQLHGEPETHKTAHDYYFKIKTLIDVLDNQIRDRVRGGKCH